MRSSSIDMKNMVLKPKKNLNVVLEQAIVIGISDCDTCKHAICLAKGIYCGRLKEYVDNLVSCPHFVSEPLEYRLYRRS